MTGLQFCAAYWWIVPLVMLVFCLIFMIRGTGIKTMCGFGCRCGPGGSALDILDKRYASGEVEQKKYEEMKGKLRQSGNGG